MSFQLTPTDYQAILDEEFEVSWDILYRRWVKADVAQVLESIFPDELESELPLLRSEVDFELIIAETSDREIRIRVEPDDPSPSYPRELPFPSIRRFISSQFGPSRIELGSGLSAYIPRYHPRPIIRVHRR